MAHQTWSKDRLVHLGQIDPQLDRHLRDKPEPSNQVSIRERREMAARAVQTLQERYRGPTTDIHKTEIFYPTTDQAQRRALLFQPAQSPTTSMPMVLQIHGGGFMIGEPEFEEALCRNLVRSFDAVCLSVSYRHAPEDPYPAAHDDALDAFKFVAANAQSWGADPRHAGFIVGGCSAGGNLAAALTLWARDNEPDIAPITGQYLLNPWLAINGQVPEQHGAMTCSYKQNADAPVLPKRMLDLYADAYRPGDLFHILDHPGGHEKLPATYLQVSGLDPLRDEAIVYEDMLRTSGTSTKMDIYPGLPHIFWFIYPQLDTHVNRFIQDQVDGFSWLLQRDAKQGVVLEK